MLWLQTSELKPLWSFSPWLVVPLYALISNVLSLYMIMAIIALLVGCSQSFASLHMYWVWALLVHPTPKNQSLPIVSTIPTYMWYFITTPKWIACVLPLNLQTLLHVLCFFSSCGSIEWFIVFSWLHTLTSMHNVLKSLILQKEQGNRVPIPNKI